MLSDHDWLLKNHICVKVVFKVLAEELPPSADERENRLLMSNSVNLKYPSFECGSHSTHFFKELALCTEVLLTHRVLENSDL